VVCRFARVLPIAAAVIATCGCAAPTLQERLGSDDPQVRCAAVHELSVGHEATDVAVRLIHMLADEDEGVRFLAAAGLHRVTGRRFDFQAQAGLRERAEAIGRWVDWYVAEHPGEEGRFEALSEMLNVLDVGGPKGSVDQRG